MDHNETRSTIENHENPTSQKGVIKWSEMALEYKTPEGRRVYLEEVGNPSYSHKLDMFHYDPEYGLQIKTRENSSELIDNDSLVEINQHLGHVPIDEFFGNVEKNLSEQDFMKQMSEFYQKQKEKIDALDYVRRIIGLDSGINAEDAALRTAFQANKQYSRQELLDAYLENLDEDLRWRKKEPVSEKIRATGVLSENQDEQSQGIVDFFNLCCVMAGKNSADIDDVKEVLYYFTGFERLIEEYKKNPDDNRFSDALKAACKAVIEEMEVE